MSQTLYRKYRPQTWADVAGQHHIKVTLEFEISADRIAHAYLFSGPRGVGKTTVARIMSRALNCTSKKGSDACGECESCRSIADGAALDVIEIDAASHRGIDAVRENVIEHARFAPARLSHKVFIIDEVHMLTTEAFNALLKTLEEPPKGTVFILATTELHKVPPTIVSRCQRFDFRKIPFTDLTDRLHALAEREKCKVDARVLEEIARNADGCLRDAEGLLGKVMAMGDGKRVSYDEALVVLPRSERAALTAFVDALLHRDVRSALGTVNDCLEGGADMDQFCGEATELLRKTLLSKLSGDVGIFGLELDDETKAKISEWAGLADTATLVRAIETLLEKRQDMKRAHPVQLPLELAAVRICEEVSDAAPVPQGGSGVAARTAPAAASATPKAAATQPRVSALTIEPEAAPAALVTPAEIAAEVARVEERMEALTQPATRVMEGGKPVTTVEAIKARWSDFVHRAGEENASLSFLLGVGEPVLVEGNRVQIGFDFAFHKDKLNEEKNRRLIEKALGTVMGAVVLIEGVMLEKKDRVVHDDAALALAAPTAGGDALLTAFGGRMVE